MKKFNRFIKIMALKKFLLALGLACVPLVEVLAQCGSFIMEPGFAFTTSSRGCAPFTVGLETRYLASVPGTEYYVNWGDGTPEETYVQTDMFGVTISHLYPNSPIDCGYDLIIDAANSCNPRGSVIAITTQVVVWTNDVLSINPGEFRVCQGFATNVLFTDNSDWNCYPRATRENSEARWIQWIYGTGPLANQIPGIAVNTITPGGYPYLDPAPGKNPIYPVFSPGQISLPINVPVTTPADLGKEFVIALKNWNQCNPYDNNIADGNPFNPVNGDLVNGDNTREITTARVVIVASPQPDFETRLANAAGAIQAVFCIGDAIYFDNNTPGIAGSSFQYTWEFYNNNTGIGTPAATRTSTNPTYTYTTTGQKMIRLKVRDANAAGNCEAIFEKVITISPSLVAQISITDASGTVIVPDFCQEASAPLTNFQARFNDVSVGTVLASTEWRWEFYNENNVLVRQEPASGFSTTQLGPFDQIFTNLGIYRVRLRIRDNATSCESVDEVQVRVFEKPKPDFSFVSGCETFPVTFADLSTVNSTLGEQIILREWDMNYDGVTFAKEATLDNQTNFNYDLGPAANYNVALRVTTDLGTCSALIVKTVTISPLPIASFTPNQTSGCSQLAIDFTNNSIVGQPDLIKEYWWEIDAGAGFQVDSIQRPSDPGFGSTFTRDFVNNTITNAIYHVRLRVITVNDCQRVSPVSDITVFPGPKSGFVSLNYSPFNNNCSPVSVNFIVDSRTQSLNPTDYLWSINDANGLVAQISTGTTPAFTYSFSNATQSIKDYAVTLRALLASGCYGDSTRTIRVNPIPASDFELDTVQFDCQRMIINMNATQKGLVQYAWSISVNGTIMYTSTTDGDNFDYEILRSPSTDQNVAVSLVTTNFATCASTNTTHNILVPRVDVMNASFTATPTTQTLPNSTVTITNTTNPGPWTYLWDFGDGTTSSSSVVTTHTYATFGTYVIKLTVTNNTCKEEQVKTVQINPIPPVVDFDYFPPSGCAPLTVNFTNKSQYADPNSYHWQFGAGEGTSRAVNPHYTYFTPGVYSVTLSASNVLGDTIKITKQLIIEVFARPQALFSLKPRIITIPGGKLYTNNQSVGANTFTWDFGDGETSNEVEPQHTYTAEGIYDVTLIAASTNGCADTTTLVAAVRVEKGAQLLIPNAFSPSLSGPDGTGENDIFLPIMRGVSEFHMTVFNRWGELLFETHSETDGWDGYYKGKLCPQDVYVYKIVAKYENGQTVTKVGDIHLIR
jgi:gliding motility-associated-like protein